MEVKQEMRQTGTKLEAPMAMESPKEAIPKSRLDSWCFLMPMYQHPCGSITLLRTRNEMKKPLNVPPPLI